MRNYTSVINIGRGKFAYVPTAQNRLVGLRHVSHIRSKWSPHSSFFHFQKGGHVAAMRLHVGSEYFLKFDIADFFPSVHRNRIIKCLKKVGYSFYEAESFAVFSTVRSKSCNKFVIPFGFTQSSLLASLDLYFSNLGKFLFNLPISVSLSVYMDDIILSSNDKALLTQIASGCVDAFLESGYKVNQRKSVLTPTSAVSAFNIILQKNGLSLNEKKIEFFENEMAKKANPLYSRAIWGYVNTINPNQSIEIGKNLALF